MIPNKPFATHSREADKTTILSRVAVDFFQLRTRLRGKDAVFGSMDNP